MGEIRRLRRNVIRCSFCMAESPLRKSDVRTEDLFRSRFKWRDHSLELNRDKFMPYKFSVYLYKGEYGWWCLKLEKRMLVKRNETWHKKKFFYCPDCTDEMVDIERIEKIMDGLFDGAKVIPFKKDVLPAREAIL
jgi:hypothetical protein